MKQRQNPFYILVNGLDATHRPLVTDEEAPTFTLAMHGTGVAVTELWLTVQNSMGAAVWKSGPVEFYTPHIRYGGPPLAPKSIYTVEIQAYNGTREAGSCTASFETGFLQQPWQAKWIEPEQQPALPEKSIQFHEIFQPGVDDGRVTGRLRPAQQLRRVFRFNGRAKNARLYASAHGLYQILLNGQPLGERLLAPETTVYPKLLYYQTYNAASFLQPGENTLEVLLADGWWAGRIGISGDSCQYGDTLGFIMQLEIQPENGPPLVVTSDAAFEGRRSHIDYADLFVGERHDYTRTPGEWAHCREMDYPTGILLAQPTAPVVAWHTLQPRYFTTPKGELMADFGQTVAGVAELMAEAPAGTEVTLDFCEVLDSEGNYFRNIIGRNKNQQDVVVCGSGLTHFLPKFTYHGFRYVRIQGIAQRDIHRLSARVMGTHLAASGSFSCSNAMLNQLQHNIQWSTRGNMLSIPTDCPQREKMGWTGDIQIFAKTAAFNYHMANFLDGWLRNLRLEQTDEGEVPVVVPCYPYQERMERSKSGYNSSPAWGDAVVLVPLYLYQSYGDATVLRQNLAAMQKWLGYIKKTAALQPDNYNQLTPAQKRRNPYLWTKGHHFGDWLIPSLRQYGFKGTEQGVEATYRVVGSCFYAVTLRAYLEVLRILQAEQGADAEGLGRQIAETEDLLKTVKQAVREEYIGDDGFIEGDLQGLYVIALYAGIGDDALRARLAAHLVRLIEAAGYTLDTGFVTVGYLMDVLCETGYEEIACRLLLQTDCPSWLYMVKNNATTMWENWAAIQPDGTVTNSSFNHYSLGCVGDWMYRRLGGIEPAAPGYRRIRFAPLFSAPLQSAGATYTCAYGTIESHWKKQSGSIEYTVKVPQNTTGVVQLPPVRDWQIQCGKGGEPVLQCHQRQDGGLELTVPGGAHTIVFTPAEAQAPGDSATPNAVPARQAT